MPPRVRAWLEDVGSSLWAVPSALTLLIVGLAWTTVEVDKLMLAAGRSDLYFAFAGGAAGARGVLEAIASTTITVTGVVFSITMVAMQLASTQYTSRVLRSFTGDRGNQIVLGVFIATFTYALLVLRTVRSASQDGQVFVPSLSVGVAILLALTSVGLLIYFIHHASRSIQVSTIVDRAARDTLALIDHVFPDPFDPAQAEECGPRTGLPIEQPDTVSSDGAGYLQAVDTDALSSLAHDKRLILRVEPRVGEFVLPGATLVSAWPAGLRDDDMCQAVQRAFVLGPERTLQEDVEFGLQQIADIALRALSPGINDPTTATTCIDRLAEVLVRLGTRNLPDLLEKREDGQLVLVATTVSFESAASVCFVQIGHHVAEHPTLACHLLTTLGAVATSLTPERRPTLTSQAQQILHATLQRTDQARDRSALEWASRWIRSGPEASHSASQQADYRPK